MFSPVFNTGRKMKNVAIQLTIPEPQLLKYINDKSNTRFNFFNVLDNNEFVNYPKNADITFCDVNLIRRLSKYPKEYSVLQSSIFYNEQAFDYRLWQEQLGTELLNNDCQLIDAATTEFCIIKDSFIRPLGDLKYTNSQVASSKTHMQLNGSTGVIVAPLKGIVSEYRFFVVNNKLATWSAYRNNQKRYFSEEVPIDVIDYAERIVDRFVPHKNCVVDIAVLRSSELKVIEYNCINCSATYAADVNKIYKYI